ncbi:hypothetical protein MY4038_004888 [Beauveria bassiana]
MGPRMLLFGLVAALAAATPLKRQERTTVDPAVYKKLVDYAAFPTMSATDPGSAALDANCSVTLSRYINQQSTDTQAAVWLRKSTREIIIGIPGTNGLRDTLTDIEVLPIPYVSPSIHCPGTCLVHAGFLLAWNSIEGQVIDAISSALEQNPGFSVVISGHSLGGAIANLAFARLKNGPFNTTGAYTYGQPRVGNREFADYIDSLSKTSDSEAGSYYRVTHAEDGVPHALPMFLGYQHPRAEYWESAHVPQSDTTYRCLERESAKCSRSTTTFLELAIKAIFETLGKPLLGFPFLPTIIGVFLNSDHGTYAGLTPLCKVA